MARGGREATRGLVLGGGGARAAYEAGVLRYVASILPVDAMARMPFQVVAGTSAGAINAAWVAATQDDFRNATDGLARMWSGLERKQVFVFGRPQIKTLLRSLRGGKDVPPSLPGFVDTTPLARMLEREVPWGALSRHIDASRLHALAVSATDLSNSRNTVFLDTAPNVGVPWSKNPFVRPRPTRIRAPHVLASAAIPLLFPPVCVDGHWYVDGVVHNNTPLRPALRLGVDRVLVISLRRHVSEDEVEAQEREPTRPMPTWSNVLGKTMNAALLDTVVHDVERLQRTNRTLDWGAGHYGDTFRERYGDLMARERGARLRPVDALLISPSEDIGELARASLGKERGMLYAIASSARKAFRGHASPLPEADALSYLAFEPRYLGRLVELGEADAAAQHDRLVEFFAPDAPRSIG